MAVYRGVFQTTAAGDRKGIYTTMPDIAAFLKRPVEAPEAGAVTVENHVMIADAGHLEWEKKVLPLLKEESLAALSVRRLTYCLLSAVRFWTAVRHSRKMCAHAQRMRDAYPTAPFP